MSIFIADTFEACTLGQLESFGPLHGQVGCFVVDVTRFRFTRIGSGAVNTHDSVRATKAFFKFFHKAKFSGNSLRWRKPVDAAEGNSIGWIHKKLLQAVRIYSI
ncbi:MAG: hypothetical protein V4772_10675 [Pseudomonadota bacterium]